MRLGTQLAPWQWPLTVLADNLADSGRWWLFSTFPVPSRRCVLPAGLQAAAEVRLPEAADFMASMPRGTLRRLLVLEGIQDPGNLVRLSRLLPKIAAHPAKQGCAAP